MATLKYPHTLKCDCGAETRGELDHPYFCFAVDDIEAANPGWKYDYQDFWFKCPKCRNEKQIMPAIAASIVKDLRDQTNCPMIDCKKALVDAGGDFEAAKKLLRERLGNLDVSKKDSGKEGLIVAGMSADRNSTEKSYTIIEIGTETDFTAQNLQVINDCKRLVANPSSSDEVMRELRSITGENISIRRIEDKTFAAKDGFVYVHHNRKIASIVLFSDKVDFEVSRSIAMHIAAATPSPVCITPEEVPENLVQNEREFFMKKAQGKPQNIQEKIVDGGLAKFKATLALNEQPLVMDPSKKVKDILPSGVKIVHFVCWKI